MTTDHIIHPEQRTTSRQLQDALDWLASTKPWTVDHDTIRGRNGEPLLRILNPQSPDAYGEPVDWPLTGRPEQSDIEAEMVALATINAVNAPQWEPRPTRQQLRHMGYRVPRTAAIPGLTEKQS